MGDIVKHSLTEVRRLPLDMEQTRVILKNTKGDIEGIFHQAEGTAGVIWVSGSLGGLDGPSFGIFKTLSVTLVKDGISSLRLNYHLPGDFDQCVYDVLVGVNFFKQSSVDNIALVGHSFGGAVVIMSAAMSTEVKAVAGLSSQTYGTHRVTELSPKPLLLIHGDRDQNLPVRASWHIFERAKEPKEIVIYKGSGHFLRECHQELYDLLRSWLIDKLKAKGQDVRPG
jgi:alpha/beta superfamily hydrolase